MHNPPWIKWRILSEVLMSEGWIGSPRNLLSGFVAFALVVLSALWYPSTLYFAPHPINLVVLLFNSQSPILDAEFSLVVACQSNTQLKDTETLFFQSSMITIGHLSNRIISSCVNPLIIVQFNTLSCTFSTNNRKQSILHGFWFEEARKRAFAPSKFVMKERTEAQQMLCNYEVRTCANGLHTRKSS